MIVHIRTEFNNVPLIMSNRAALTTASNRDHVGIGTGFAYPLAAYRPVWTITVQAAFSWIRVSTKALVGLGFL